MIPVQTLKKTFYFFFLLIVREFALHKCSDNFLYCGFRNTKNITKIHNFFSFPFSFWISSYTTFRCLAFSSILWFNTVLLKQTNIVTYLCPHWNNISHGRYVGLNQKFKSKYKWKSCLVGIAHFRACCKKIIWEMLGFPCISLSHLILLL